MAYGTRWTIQGTNEQTGNVWNAYIKERDYTGSNTGIDPGEVPISVSYTRTGFHSGVDMWNIAASTCEVTFSDDVTGLLQDVLNGDDEQFQIEIDNSTVGQIEWTGFVVPDSYTYSLYAPGISRLRAVDRINDLKNIAYANGTTTYTGRDSLLGILTDCLSPTNIDIGFAIHDMVYPHFDSNNLDTTDDVLVNLFADRTVFQSEDGDPFSCFDVLEQVLIAKKLRLYQVENRWLITQRKRNIFDSSGTDVFTVFLYDSSGVAEATPTENLTARKEVSINDDSTSFAIAPTAGGTIPIGKASATYYHNTPTEGLLQNTGFQSAIQSSGGTSTDNWRPGGTMPTATLDSPGVGNFSTGDAASTQALYMDSIYESTTGFTTIADAIANLNDYVEQTTSGTIVGGSDITLQIDFNYRQEPVSGTLSFAGQMYLFIELHVDTYKLYRASHTGAYAWSTTPGTDEEKLPFIVNLDPGTDNKISFTTPALDDSGAISGEVYFKIYAPTEDKHTSPNTAQIDRVGYDEVTLTVVDSSDSTQANTATQITLTYNGNVNRSEPPTPTLVIGDGPDGGYKSRLTATTSVGGSINVTGNWSYLPSVVDSGFSLHQFYANQLLLEHGKCNRKIRASVYSSDTSDAVKPYHNLVFENPSNSIQYDYTWNELVWRPCNTKQILSGSFVQFQEAGGADQICTIDVKANTALLQSISISEGLPCIDPTDFTPTVPATHIYWGDANARIRKAQITSTPTFTAQTLRTLTTNREVKHIRVDQASGYIFVIERDTVSGTFYVTRSDLEGDNITLLLTYAGSTVPTNFAVDRVNDKLLINDEESPGVSLNFYDYDGTLSSNHDTETGGNGGWPCVAPDGVNVYYRYIFIGSPSNKDELRKNGTDLPHDSPLSQSMDSSTMLVDEDDGHFYVYSSGDDKIVKLLTTGGSESNVKTGLTVGDGLGYDRANEQLYFTESSGDISRCDYSGANTEKVIEGGVSAPQIVSICLGV